MVASKKTTAPRGKKAKHRPLSRAARWTEACANKALDDLRAIQEEYKEWQGRLPKSLQQSGLGEILGALCSIDLDSIDLASIDLDISLIYQAEALGLDNPRRFSKD